MKTYCAVRLRSARAVTAIAVTLFCMLAGPRLVAQDKVSASQAELASALQLLRSGNAADAKVKLDAVIKESPRSADALTWRGICENQLEQYTLAAIDFKAALQLSQGNLAAHYNLALSLIRLHQTDAAIEQLRLVVAAQPRAVQPIYNLAILLEATGSFAEAAEQLRTARAAAPEDSGVTLHLLMDDLKLNGSAEMSSLIRALADNSTPVSVEQQAGEALLAAGRFADAVILLKGAHDRDSTSAEGNIPLARALMGSGRDAEAIALLEATTLPGGDREEGKYLLATAYLATGAISKAAENFEAAARLDSKDARPFYQLGLIAEATPQGQAEAARLLTLAHAADPANATYTLAFARVLLANDRAEESQALLQDMHATSENEAQRLALLGVALAATHKMADAVPELKKAIALDPSLALAHNILGFCYLQQGQYAQAAETYGQASELEPRRPLYARDAALAFERAGQTDQAMHFAQRAVSLDEANAGDHALLGKLLAASGKRDQGIQELLRAAALNPDLDSACYLLARTYQQVGDREQALVWSAKLTALKQKHEAEFALQKKAAALPIRSSTLLEGGSLGGDEAGVP